VTRISSAAADTAQFAAAYCRCMMMNGADSNRKQTSSQSKKASGALGDTNPTSGTGQKKRRKGENLKPIITTDGRIPAEQAHPPTSNNPAG
jgi:hypothetical protein